MHSTETWPEQQRAPCGTAFAAHAEALRPLLGLLDPESGSALFAWTAAGRGRDGGAVAVSWRPRHRVGGQGAEMSAVRTEPSRRLTPGTEQP
ncbi:hypothetical protein EDD29_3406 [Actinocorallia herbida]|uniref:Uncharacterized protein n=1 Tax=Actinocorallia herbida TaxID=58109 RepID=A0A3N1CX97_9ACTN|nr:hypothetical protein EDD29_3406 [Actinocorallia herbida]